MNTTDIRVPIPASPETSYDVCIGAGILSDILPDVRRRLPDRRPFLVTDAAVVRAGHAAALTGGKELSSFVVTPPGEISKTLRTVEAVCTAMERECYGRDSVLLALGGGTVGDVAGFAAAVFKRGVPCVQIPTTTVAQADSAIGGKTGVDSDLSKNAYGAFHHPARVYVDVRTLRTLDERNYRAGLVESVKHGLIADAEYFAAIENGVPALLARDEAILRRLAERNAAIKGRVVFEDPTEKNLRRVLNYGHTIGHAVESASRFELLHGEAVAIGIAGACRIAERLGLAASELTRRVCAVLERLGLPLHIPRGIPADALHDAMRRDKKSVDQSPRFVLLETVGAVHAPSGAVAVQVPPDVLNSVIAELRA